MDDIAFREWLSSYTDADRAMSAFAERGRFFRVNTLKIGIADFESCSKLSRERSPYYEAAYALREPPEFDIGRTWDYFLGYIHPQSLPSILDSLVLAPGPEDTVLDVAASPGSKFSHMAMMMGNRGVLVGNEVKKEKLSALYSNINRLNILNSIVSIRDGADLKWEKRFTKIMLDAPCTALGSGDGAPARWDQTHSQKISVLQKKMLFSAYDALKPGGVLVYSTCTYAKEENEEVVANLLTNVPTAKLVPAGLDIPHEPGLSEFGAEFRGCMRIYPHHLGSEGFFIAKIRKGE